MNATEALSLCGISAIDAAPLSGVGHLHQSLSDILTTPFGSRVMRPRYGSGVFKLLDRPVNPEFLIDLYYEVIVSIDQWEPRVRVMRVRAEAITKGQIILNLEVALRKNNQRLSIEGLVINRTTDAPAWRNP